jgi:hypothetical protein
MKTILNHCDDMNGVSDRYRVHFEDESVAPAAAKTKNLRIVFKLPEVTEGDDNGTPAATTTWGCHG